MMFDCFDLLLQVAIEVKLGVENSRICMYIRFTRATECHPIGLLCVVIRQGNHMVQRNKKNSIVRCISLLQIQL